jgi:acyl-coenzyme A thioesterase PaaI-like protein
MVPDGRGRLHARPTLQSWPGIVHGGGVVALLDLAAMAFGRAPMPRVVDARLTAPVPIDTTLALEGHADDGAVRLSVLQDGQPLASGAISALPRVSLRHKHVALTYLRHSPGPLIPGLESCSTRATT